jgi:hypothetical protein
MHGGFIISKLANAALIAGIIFFIGYGVALNADHIPLNLVQDIFKNNHSISNGTLNNNQTGINPQKTVKNAKKRINNTKSKASTHSTNNNGISSSKARSISNKYIDEPGASSGSPKLVNIGGKDTYVVPVESNNKNVGEIYIDPETGENIGGAGGAP